MVQNQGTLDFVDKLGINTSPGQLAASLNWKEPDMGHRTMHGAEQGQGGLSPTLKSCSQKEKKEKRV